MVHQPSGGARGSVSDMKIDLEESLKLKKLLEEIMSRHTGQTKKKIGDDMDRDYYMDAKAAVKYGIIDKVIEKA